MTRRKSRINGEDLPKAKKPGFDVPDFQCPKLTSVATADGEIKKGDAARESESSSAEGCIADQAILRGASHQGKVSLGKYLCPCGMSFRARMN